MEWWSAGVMGKRNPPILLYFNTPLRLLASEIFLTACMRVFQQSARLD